MKDIFLKYYCALDDHRFLPVDYAERSIPIIEKAIKYFPKYDNIGHFSGIITHKDKFVNKYNNEVRPEELEFLLVKEYYNKRNWKKRYRENVAKIDKILEQRYNNKIPTKVRFYHAIGIESYFDGYKIDEISIGVGHSITSEFTWYPDVYVKTRSVDGHIKECEKACQEFIKLIKAEFKPSHFRKHYSIYEDLKWKKK